MFKIMVLAFQMDKTRVVTYMMNNDLSPMNFSYLGAFVGASTRSVIMPGKKISWRCIKKSIATSAVG